MSSTPPPPPAPPRPLSESADSDSPHRLSTDLPPLPIIPRGPLSRYAPRPTPTSSLPAPTPTDPNANPKSTFSPVQRTASRLSNRSFNQTFIDAAGTITALPEIRRQESRASGATHFSKATRLGPGIAESPVEESKYENEEGKVVQISQDGMEVTFPDGGAAAWLVVLGGVCALFCGFGLTAALGGFQTYYAFVLIPQYPGSTIAWITGFQAFVTFGLAAFTGALFDKIGHRPLIFCGTVLSGLGLILLGFCTQYWQLFLVHALPIGIGNNLIFISPMGVVGQWFSRRRGLAFGTLTAGASLGSCIWPLIIAKFPERVGFPWTVRIMGLITLALGTAAFFLLKTRLPPKPPGPFFHFGAFRKLSYTCVALSAFTYTLSFFSFLSFVGTFGTLAGLGDFAPYLLIIANGASAFGRISLGLLADYLGPYNITTFSVLLMAILYWAWITLRSSAGLTAFAVLFGFWSGAYVSQQAPMSSAEADDMRFAGTLVGQVMFMMSFAQLFGGPIFGALLGNGSPESQLANAPKAIAMGASMMTLTAVLLGIGRLARSREVWAKV